MRIVVHGGECCGIAHIYDFGSYPTRGKIACLKRYITTFKKGTVAQSCNWIRNPNRHGCLEVTLADTQFKVPPRWWLEDYPGAPNKSWETVLLEMGFKKVNSFYNSNSGNTVKIFHLNV